MMQVERSTGKSSFSTVSKQLREQRFADLAKPKHSKAMWACIEPPMKWGNQELIRPLTGAAMNATASDRVNTLSTPKADFIQNRNRPHFVHSTGRSSVICEVSPPAIKANASARVEELAHPTKLNQAFQQDRTTYILDCGRTSPIMLVSEAACKASERERTTQLAAPRPQHKDYYLPKQVMWPVSASAMKGHASDHVEKLSLPKMREDRGYRDAQWNVSRSARNATASNRVMELSQPKKLNDKYRPTRSVEWKIPQSALRAYATERLQQLSAPIVRDTMDHVQFDPLAFQVKESALKGYIPERIHQLSQPIVRGQIPTK